MVSDAGCRITATEAVSQHRINLGTDVHPRTDLSQIDLSLQHFNAPQDALSMIVVIFLEHRP